MEEEGWQAGSAAAGNDGRRAGNRRTGNMKVSPEADYPVQVFPEAREYEALYAQFFAGIFQVVLNHVVNIVFVPDVGGIAPPWDPGRLSQAVDRPASLEQARFETVVLASYAVTPNQALADTRDHVYHPAADGYAASIGTVFYVSPTAFERYADDLARLAEIVYSAWPAETVSGLRGYEVIRFLEEKVVASPGLKPYDAMMLGRTI
jgi:hypothetical protein